MSTPFITFLSTARIAFGAISSLAPSTTLSLFRVATTPVPGPTILATRMFGIRDAALGGLLYTADSPAAARRALIAGAVVDGVDALACVYSFLQGDLDGPAADLVGGGAVLFLAMGLWGLRGLGKGAGAAGLMGRVGK